MVKVRLVKLGVTGLQAHLRYIERAGVSPEGAPGQAYGAVTDSADTAAFAERCVGDRHQFRCIVAPEEAAALGDLKTYTRGLVGRMEQDLATRLDWVAVDHWDTDNPHTHLVIRGKDDAGRDLILAREYLSQGLRTRAGELATEWLGPRTDREIQATLEREVDAHRWTGLDRTLKGLASDGCVDLHRIASTTTDAAHRSRLVGRLQVLTTLNVARSSVPGVWWLAPEAEPTLRALGERVDIVRTMQRALGAGREAYAIFDPATAHALTGRIAATGLADEHHDHPYLVLDGVDGRAHYVRLPLAIDDRELPVGGIITVSGRSGERAADRTIAALAQNGIYTPAEHVRLAAASCRPGQDPAEFVAAHERRLEALRRAGVTERLADGTWRVPPDLATQGQRVDRRRGGGTSVTLESALPLERQARVIGATWLDRELVSGRGGYAVVGFGGEVRQALIARADFLVEQRLADCRGTQGVVSARNLLATLRDRELAGVAATLAAQSGQVYRPVRDGQRVRGFYRERLQLASGSFAVVDDGQGFALVPWRPVLRYRLGQTVTAVVRGDLIAWQVGRSHTRIPPA